MKAKEIWKSIPGWTGLYEVSNLGRVRSLERFVPNNLGKQRIPRRIRKNTVAANGYLVVSLSVLGKVKVEHVHALVMRAFRGPTPSGKEIRHRDGNPLNPRLTNLRFGTRKENCQDKLEHGTEIFGTRNGSAKLNERQVRLIRAYSAEGLRVFQICQKLGFSRCVVTGVTSGITYRNVN